jgi:hypothetical protein
LPTPQTTAANNSFFIFTPLSVLVHFRLLVALLGGRDLLLCANICSALPELTWSSTKDGGVGWGSSRDEPGFCGACVAGGNNRNSNANNLQQAMHSH